MRSSCSQAGLGRNDDKENKMTRSIKAFARIALCALAGATGVMVDATASLRQSQLSVAPAEARVGRPGTPMSYAGVARRTTRRAVYGTAAVGAAAAYGAYGYNNGCGQGYAYGRRGYPC
jgi:hypothetical protein